MSFTLSSNTDYSRHRRRLGLLASAEMAAWMNVTIKDSRARPRAVAQPSRLPKQYVIRNNVLHHDDSQTSTDSISAPNHSGAIYPMNSLTIRYLVIVVGFSAITVSYWLAADPPSPWILAITAAGILVSIGITLAKKRAGHFDNPDPTRGTTMIAKIIVASLIAFALTLGLYAASWRVVLFVYFA